MTAPVSPVPRTRNPEERERIARFVAALNQSMVVNGFSQRRLAHAIEVESGTLTKYLKGLIDPTKVGLRIQQRLAQTLGVSLDSLVMYYYTGEYANALSAEEVEGWIRSEAGQSALPDLLQALGEAGRRWSAGMAAPVAPPAPPALPPYDWPLDTVDALGLPESLLRRMGLTAEALQALAETGEFDETLVEGFALATGLAPDDVRQAFMQRVALG